MMNIPPPGFVGGDTPAVPLPTTSAEGDAWARKWPDPVTVQQAYDLVREAQNYGWATWDKICHTSMCPPIEAIVPSLAKAIRDMDVERDGLNVLIGKGGGKANITAALRAAIIPRGKTLYIQAARVWTDTQRQDSEIKQAIAKGVSSIPTIVKGGLIVAGIFAAASIASSVASAAHSVKRTIRG